MTFVKRKFVDDEYLQNFNSFQKLSGFRSCHRKSIECKNKTAISTFNNLFFWEKACLFMTFTMAVHYVIQKKSTNYVIQKNQAI